MAKIIGLTGGIGSGKTTVAKMFEKLGVPVYYADDEAKKILNQPETVLELEKVLGNDVAPGGKPDRAKIASIVFADKKKLELLNGIIHPKVAEHFAQWAQQNKLHPYVIKEAAILFESGSYKNCDAVIVVTAPFKTRIERVMQRDNITEAQVVQRMQNQWDDDKKKALGNYIINNTNLINTEKQVVNINSEIITENL